MNRFGTKTTSNYHVQFREFSDSNQFWKKIYQDMENETIRKHGILFQKMLWPYLHKIFFVIGTFANSKAKNFQKQFIRKRNLQKQIGKTFRCKFFPQTRNFNKTIEWQFDKLKHLPSKGRDKSEFGHLIKSLNFQKEDSMKNQQSVQIFSEFKKNPSNKTIEWQFDKLKHLPSKGWNKSESIVVRIECMTFFSCWNVPRSKCRLW